MLTTISRSLFLALAVTIALPLSASEGKKSPLEAFPAAAEGMIRLVIQLPEKEASLEANLKVEISAGKIMQGDGVNRLHLGTNLEPVTLRGWGYTYYQVMGGEQAISTLMAPPEGSEPVEQFVSGSPLLLRYNSKLPIVIYAPDGFEVRYRLWQAPPEQLVAGQG